MSTLPNQTILNKNLHKILVLPLPHLCIALCLYLSSIWFILNKLKKSLPSYKLQILLFFLCYLCYCYCRRKKEQLEGDAEDDNTHNSSPGGWQGRLSAFLHVHRGSRASSRKSSRASDASDLSELGAVWLNLPLLLMSGTQANGEEPHEEVPAK